MPTIKDVARLAGVSYTTVSHVINGTRRVAPETAARVQAAVAELRFRPSSSARGLKTGRSGLIGVLTYSSVDPYFDEVLFGIEEAAREAGFGIIVCHDECDSSCESASEAGTFSLLAEKGVDGLIMNSFQGTEESFALVRAAPFPTVVLQSRLPGTGLDFMHTDDFAGGQAATGRLLELGHRRIACVSGPSLAHHSTGDRRLGWEAALAAAGLEAREDYFADGDYSFEGGYAALRRLLGLPERPTAFFFYSDLMALGGLRAAADLGLSVPRDLSLVGFDDIVAASYAVPRLTTLWHPKAELGRRAVERIRARLARPELPAEGAVLPIRLVERESAGPAPRS